MQIKGSTSGGAAAASSGTGAVRDSKDGKKKREHEVSRTDRMKFCELVMPIYRHFANSPPLLLDP